MYYPIAMKKIIKFLVLACLFFSLNAYSKEIRLIHITDINLNTKNAYKLQKTIKEINKFDDIDFVLFGGNNIAKAYITNLRTFLYLLKRVNKKCVVLLGSSDVNFSDNIDKKYYLKRVKMARFLAHSSKPNYTFKKKDCLFVIMDGTKQYFKSSNGYYGKNELLWLQKILDKNKDKNIVILQHFPLLKADSSWQETAKMEDYNELLKKYDNVKVIISGHYDKNIELKKDGIYHIVTQSYENSNTYKIIELDFDYDFIATYLIQ